MADKAKREEIVTLTGLRAFAALWVLLFHLDTAIMALFPYAWGYRHVLLTSGQAGVDLFFILSGFILSYNYAERFTAFSWRRYRQFLWLRLARIYPVHLATIALVAAVAAAIGPAVIEPDPQWLSPGDLVLSLLLVQAWPVPMHLAWNAVSWSLSMEWLAYLAFPAALALTGAVRRPWALVLAAAGLLIGLPLFLATCGHVGHPYARIVAGFLAGCLLYRLHEQGWGRDWPWGRVAAGAFAALVAASIGVSVCGLPFEALSPILGLWIYALAWERGVMARLFRSRAAVYGGRISYSLYMTHWLFATLFAHRIVLSLWAAPFALKLGATAFALAFQLAVAVATYHLVEEPCRKVMRRWGAQPRQAGPATREA